MTDSPTIDTPAMDGPGADIRAYDLFFGANRPGWDARRKAEMNALADKAEADRVKAERTEAAARERQSWIDRLLGREPKVEAAPQEPAPQEPAQPEPLEPAGHQGGDDRELESTGWAFGLPPGIATEQWPIDRNNGFPLKHGFTLELPSDWARAVSEAVGYEVAGVSFFGTSDEHADGMPYEVKGMEAALGQESVDADDPFFPFWSQMRTLHPRARYMRDILDCDFALIHLSPQELAGKPCHPPRLADEPVLADAPRPTWLDEGALAAILRAGRPYQLEPLGLVGAGGVEGNGVEGNGLEARVTIRRAERDDPNAGRTPTDVGVSGDYVQPFGEDYRPLPWSEEFQLNHMGGTFRPVQAMPNIGPYSIGVEEYVGDFNYGTGNAQIDIVNAVFDWACG